jgi:hypothetical protein
MVNIPTERGNTSSVDPVAKKELIFDLLDEISYRKQVYYKKMAHYKRLDDVSEAIIIGSGSVAVSSLIVTVPTLNPITLILGAVCSSISTIGGATKRVLNINSKYESCKTTYTQLSDLERMTRAVLVKNHLTSNDLQNLLADLNHSLSLIEDTSLPIKLGKKKDTVTL